LTSKEIYDTILKRKTPNYPSYGFSIKNFELPDESTLYRNVKGLLEQRYIKIDNNKPISKIAGNDSSSYMLAQRGLMTAELQQNVKDNFS